MTISRGDIEAMTQVLDQLGNEADSLPLEDAVELLVALDVCSAVLRRTESFVQTQALQQLEKPKTIGSKRYRKIGKYVKRHHHHQIARLISDRVKVDKETGEIASAEVAVAKALNIALRLYTSDSTTVKTGEMARLLGVRDLIDEGLAHEELTGWELQVIALEEPCPGDDAGK